ncbi:hypothetical protein K438DRAFT_1786638 [Mycena galopus ATCC 62051]|nr:hypothetical protein K438DRAFT_1786638 [Mycena galopus ATCC 62051]
MSSPPLTPLPHKDVADARERLAAAAADLQIKENEHEKVKKSRAKKTRKEAALLEYEAAQHTFEQALAAVSAAEKAVGNHGLPSPSQINQALQDLVTATVQADADAKAKVDTQPPEDADAKAEEEADAKAKAKAKEEADAKTKEEADAKAKAKEEEDAKAKAKEEADAKTKEEADAKAKAKAKEEADAKTKEEADAKAKEEADAKVKAKEEADAKVKAKEEADAKTKEDADVDAKAKAKEDADTKVKAKTQAKRRGKDQQRPAKKTKTRTTGDGAEEGIAKRLQDIDAEDSDESDSGTTEVGKKRKRQKTRKVEGEDGVHWEQLITDTAHQMEHAEDLTDAMLKELRKTKEHAEAQLAKVTNRDINDNAEDSDAGSDDDDKVDVEVKWDQSFAADDSGGNRRFPNGGQSWRDNVLRQAEEAVDNFLKDPKRKANKVPPRLRRLMRMVAEVVPRCATASKELALHILTTQQGKIHCRFHDLKRGTKGAKEFDVPGLIVGVPYRKDLVPTEKGFLHCGCDEKAALWEFFWFKTWTITSANPKIQGFERMRADASDVLSARQRAFFSQAFSAGTFLEIDDMYSFDPPYDSLEWFTRLRRLQADRMIFILNQSLPDDSEWEYALAKKTKDKRDEDGDEFSSDLVLRHRQSIPSSPVPPSPLTVYPTPAYILIETLDDANRYLSTIVDGDVVGFDLEWVDLPNRHKLSTGQKKAKLREEILHAATFSIDWTKVQVCLAQIAIPNNPVYIVHIRRIKGMLSVTPCPQFLINAQNCQLSSSASARALRSERFRLGYSLMLEKADGQQLWDSFRLNLFSVVSLGHAARLAYPEDILPLLPYGNEPGLAPVVERALNFRIPKDLQVSAWDLIPLSEAQQNYAATDSHAALASHAVIQRELAECGFAVNENWYMYDVVNRARVVRGGVATWTAQCPWWSAQGIFIGHSSVVICMSDNSGVDARISPEQRMTNSLRAHRELVTGMSLQLSTEYSVNCRFFGILRNLRHICIIYVDPQSGPTDVQFQWIYAPVNMPKAHNSALARGIAKYKSEAHRRSAAEYRWRHRQQLKKHDPDRQGRKERALEADAKYRQKHAESLAWKQRLRRQK